VEMCNPYWKRLGSIDEGEELFMDWDECG